MLLIHLSYVASETSCEDTTLDEDTVFPFGKTGKLIRPLL